MYSSQGERLRVLIRECRRTQQQTADGVGVHRDTLQEWFKKKVIPEDNLRKVLKYLKVEYSDFMSGVNQVNEDAVPYTWKEKIKDLEKENEILRSQLADKDTIIDLMKRKKTTNTAMK